MSGASRAHWNESTIVIKHQEYNNSGAKGNSFFINDICPVLLQETKQGTFAPHKSMRFRGCVSRVFNFTYLRVVGKTAGTFVEKTYLIPQLCKLLESSGTVRLSKQKTKLFGGSVVPKDCERQLLKLGWLDCHIQGNLTEVYIGHVFTVIRNPYARAVSIYKYIVERSGKNTSFANCYGGKLESLDECFSGLGANSDHWREISRELQNNCFDLEGSGKPIVALFMENLVEGLDAMIKQPINAELKLQNYNWAIRKITKRKM